MRLKRGGFLAMLLVAAALGALVLSAEGHQVTGRAGTAGDAGIATGGEVMKTITPYQLGQERIQLAPTVAVAAITPKQADADAKLFRGPILETVLAECTVSGRDLGPCYAVSFLPPKKRQSGYIGNLVTSTKVPLPPPTFEIELISAKTGEALTGASAGWPPSPLRQTSQPAAR